MLLSYIEVNYVISSKLLCLIFIADFILCIYILYLINRSIVSTVLFIQLEIVCCGNVLPSMMTLKHAKLLFWHEQVKN